MKKAIIITTISQSTTDGMLLFSKIKGTRLILVGDTKSPSSYDVDADYLDLNKQRTLFNSLSQSLPSNHYTRKNLGYAFAISEGYSMIAESDDDNIPYDNWYEKFYNTEEHDNAVVSPRFPNMYSLFTNDKIWPRGYPIDLINDNQEILIEKKRLKIGVWQGLANQEADVDAIYRLVIGKEIIFDNGKRFVLDQDVVSPFNSQNTVWMKNSFAYLYLPCTVSFRYTDILRSFVAQFGLWARGLHIGFISPTCYQIRNPHRLLNDFSDEITMYLGLHKVIDTLRSCFKSLTGSDKDLIMMYHALHKAGIVKKEEISVAEIWIDTIQGKL